MDIGKVAAHAVVHISPRLPDMREFLLHGQREVRILDAHVLEFVHDRRGWSYREVADVPPHVDVERPLLRLLDELDRGVENVRIPASRILPAPPSPATFLVDDVNAVR